MLPPEITSVERQAIALGLLFVKDYMTDGQFDVAKTKVIIDLALKLGLKSEFNQAMLAYPPMKVKPR